MFDKPENTKTVDALFKITSTNDKIAETQGDAFDAIALLNKIDPDSLRYVAFQRSVATLVILLGREKETITAADAAKYAPILVGYMTAWIDGFTTGSQYEER